VLSLPAGYREDDAMAHLAHLDPTPGTVREQPGAALPPAVAPLDAGEDAALSFAAVYHPWMSLRIDGDDGPTVEAVPPDGGVCGRIARRALTRGAWITPANETLEAGLALDPLLSRDAEARLLARGVNVVRREARGFVIAGADTLSQDPTLRTISARRLLILLRRLVLREAVTYVFQPHDRVFRNMVVRRFETVLSDLHRRGAFAGDTPAEGFRVVGAETNNPTFSVEQGRFVVDLMVAPSEPLRFIRVRLLQTDPATVAVEEG
jgi:phage tail sheath protein FI